MPDVADELLRSATLSGARIWLSGAIPESNLISDEQRTAIGNCVRRFSRRVFQQDGHIVHGSHPTFTPLLLEEARAHQDRGGRKDCLILAVSRLWSKDPNAVPVNEWRKTAIVYEVPEVTGQNARNDSLALLRKWMAARCDAVVVLGGKWWREVTGQAGVPVELGLALERGLPCFLLAGFGGAAEEVVARNPQVLSSLKNGLDLETNRKLSTRSDVDHLAEEICECLRRLPLVRGRGSDGVSFRILALDGGGLKGAFTAAALAAWEKQSRLRIVDHFDMIAGTSTGGIIAIGLGLGLSAEEILQFYLQRGKIIFPITRIRSRVLHALRHIFVPKYSQQVLLRELRAAYYRNGTPIPLKASKCRLVIPTYHVVGGASHQFRTPHHQDLTADADTQAAYVALATAAAPTFFAAARIADMVTDTSYFDGGVWANAPAMAAIVEAVCFLRIPVERLDVLSVGATEEPFTVRELTHAGILHWLRRGKLLSLLMNVQQESSITLAKRLVGETRFMRVNVTVPARSYSLDSAKEIGELAQLGSREALKPENLAQIKSRFLNGVPVTPWESFSPTVSA
jgi:patatin-like phospholipase/acyl hydrolase